MQLYEGKTPAKQIKDEIKNQLKQEAKKPKLVVILVGDNYASQLYVKYKVMACKDVGMLSEVVKFPNSVSEQEIIAKINQYNQDSTVNGILVQLPLPANLNELKILNTIDESKDVDGLTAVNAGKLLQGDTSAIIPCTVKAIGKLLDYYKVTVSGQNIVIINRSNIVGKPLALYLSNLGATVSLLHKKTRNINQHLMTADIICTATGVSNLFTGEDIKEGVAIFDIAINHQKNNYVTGDVNFDLVKNKVSGITPVPGGVGPMTIAMLIENLMILFKNQKK